MTACLPITIHKGRLSLQKGKNIGERDSKIMIDSSFFNFIHIIYAYQLNLERKFSKKEKWSGLINVTIFLAI